MARVAKAVFTALGALAASDDGACMSSGNPAGVCDTSEASLVQLRSHLGRTLRAGETKVIVRYRNDVGRSDAQNSDVAGAGVDMPRLHTEAVIVNASGLKALRSNPNVEAVDMDTDDVQALVYHRGETLAKLHRSESTPWGITKVKAGQLEQGATSIKVCVIDTGYGLGHEDLPTEAHGIGGTDGYDQSWDVDGHSHGTHCAGTIGAIGNNSKGVTSVNPDPNKFSFHIGKGLSNSGSGSGSGVLAALEGCLDAGAKVVSMSLGGGGASTTAANAYKDAYEEGVLIIAAAGNGGPGAGISYPAGYPHVMSVAATDSNNNVAGFSQRDAQTEIAAPGVSVQSTVTGNNGNSFSYASYSGTSMACPHVAGVAALVWSHFPWCTNNQIRNVLLRSATDLGDPGCDTSFGWGLVDAVAAYNMLVAENCTAGGTDPSPVTEGGIGGCQQPVPGVTTTTSTTTTCGSSQMAFSLTITIDNYGDETSWTVKDADSQVVASGGGYAANSESVATACLENADHIFRIEDSYGDGICCSYGQGGYELSVDGVVIKTGGDFGSSESVPIPANSTPTPTPPTPAPPTPEPTPEPTTPSPTTPTSTMPPPVETTLPPC